VLTTQEKQTCSRRHLKRQQQKSNQNAIVTHIEDVDGKRILILYYHRYRLHYHRRQVIAKQYKFEVNYNITPSERTAPKS